MTAFGCNREYKAGNVSLPSPVVAGDTTAPAAPTDLEVRVDGLALTGKGEVGSTVTVKNAAGVQVGTGIVGLDGLFTVGSPLQYLQLAAR